MPKVRRHNLPPALLQHLLDRIQQRRITPDQLGLLATWLTRQGLRPARRSWCWDFSDTLGILAGLRPCLVRCYLMLHHSSFTRKQPCSPIVERRKGLAAGRSIQGPCTEGAYCRVPASQVT